MADPPPHLDNGDEAGVAPDREQAAGTPRWVYVFGIIALAVVLLFVILLLIGGGHGPGRHTSSGDAAGHTRPAGTARHVVHRP